MLANKISHRWQNVEFDERAVCMSDKLDHAYQYMTEIPMLAILKLQAHISPSAKTG